MKEAVEGYNNEDLRYKIDDEGLDYFFTHYINPDAILDAGLRAKVYNFALAREAMVNYLIKLGVLTDNDI